MIYLNEDYKNYFKQRLAESILSEAMDPGVPEVSEPAMAGGGILRGLGKVLGIGGKGATRWMWQGRRIPDHVKRSVKNSAGYARQGSGILPFDMWLDDFVHFDRATGQWFRRSDSRGWVHIAEDGTTTKVPFDPSNGVPPGWQFGVGGAFLVTPSDEPEEVESETAPGSEGIEATAPYRVA
jgi:hypothetical protein